MKTAFLSLFLLFCGSSFAQISPDSSRKEQERIASLARNNNITFFATARELRLPAKAGDAVVLQDEQRQLYFGIVDSVRSLSDIRIVLYPKAGQRELVNATYDDLFYLKSAERPKNFTAARQEVPDYVQEIASRDNKINQLELRMNQAAFSIGDAGKAYETADILRYSSIGAFMVGAFFFGVGSLSNSQVMQTTGTLLYVGSLGTGIGAVVYRFKGHNRLKQTAAILRN